MRFELDKCSPLKCDDLLDALHRAIKKSRTSETLGGVVCFELLEWKNFVKLYRHRFARYPHLFRPDAIQGAVCANADNVRRKTGEQPYVKIIGGRKIVQICIKSSAMVSKLEHSIKGVYMINAQR